MHPPLLQHAASVNSAAAEDSCSSEDGCGDRTSYSKVEPTSQLPNIFNKCINILEENSHDLLKINVLLNNKNVCAVVDSGAVNSIISQKLADTLNLTVVPSVKRLRVLGDNNFITVGKAECILTINNITMKPLNVLCHQTLVTLTVTFFWALIF